MTTWADATRVKAIDSHTYECNFPDDWCIGSVPNGGYVTGCFLSVVSTHFRTTLSKQHQPHTIAFHAEFLRRTQVGPALFKVEDVKLGRQTSIIHVRMSQDGREEVVAYVTNSNIKTEKGVSFDTEYSLHPPPPPVDLAKLKEDQDPLWRHDPGVLFSKFRKASAKVKFHYPRNGQQHRSLADEWLRFSTGEKFKQESIGFVSDMFPQIVEYFRDNTKDGPFWYPTLLLNLDVKKALPDQGVDWLFVRVRSKQIKNGRLDLEVVIMDAEGDIVALSNHVSLVLDASRNMAERRKQGEGDSKL